MKYMSGITATVAVLALAVPTWAQSSTTESAALSETHMVKSQKIEPDAEIIMSDKAFRIAKGETAKGFMLLAGTRADIVLRNEDSVAHEFVSSMLFNIPFRLDGNGTFVKLPNAAGVRVDTGQTVRLTFDVPQDSKEFQNLYEVFWCNVHGKQHGDKMRGEVLIVEHRGEVGGG